VKLDNLNQQESSCPKENEIQNHNPPQFDPIDLKKIISQEDLEALGADYLKHELMRLGLKCGGTLKERASRLWQIKLYPQLQFSSTLKAKEKKQK